MTFKELLSKMTSRRKEDREMFEEMEKQDRFQRMVEDRKKSANERELERLKKEEREEMVREELEYYRNKRKKEIEFGHNPLDVPNITKEVEWNIMREPNQFKGKGNMFMNQKNIFKDNKRVV